MLHGVHGQDHRQGHGGHFMNLTTAFPPKRRPITPAHRLARSLALLASEKFPTVLHCDRPSWVHPLRMVIKSIPQRDWAMFGRAWRRYVAASTEPVISMRAFEKDWHSWVYDEDARLDAELESIAKELRA